MAPIATAVPISGNTRYASDAVGARIRRIVVRRWFRESLLEDREFAIGLAQHARQTQREILQQADLDRRRLAIELRQRVARQHAAFNRAQRSHAGRSW
jgi:hypothetical protein